MEGIVIKDSFKANKKFLLTEKDFADRSGWHLYTLQFPHYVQSTKINVHVYGQSNKINVHV